MTTDKEQRAKPAPAPEQAQESIVDRLDEAKLPRAKMGKTRKGVSGRLSPKLRTLIEVMAYEGASIVEGAARAGMELRSARQAFRKSHVKHSYNQLVKEIRDNAAQSAYLRINHISQTAASEHVKLDANKWVAGVDGISPVQKVSGNVNHTVRFENYDYSEADTIEGTATDADDDA